LLTKHGVKIQYAKSKRSVSIIERDHLTAEKNLFLIQDTIEYIYLLVNAIGFGLNFFI